MSVGKHGEDLAREPYPPPCSRRFHNLATCVDSDGLTPRHRDADHNNSCCLVASKVHPTLSEHGIH